MARSQRAIVSTCENRSGLLSLCNASLITSELKAIDFFFRVLCLFVSVHMFKTVAGEMQCSVNLDVDVSRYVTEL